jgi:hypothetical protein
MRDQAHEAQQWLAKAIKAGLTFSDCIKAFAATAEDDKRYADFARNHLARDGETEIDAIDRRQSRR